MTLASASSDAMSSDPVVDFNVYNPDQTGIGHDESWLALRDQSPGIIWTTANGGHWIATRGDLISSIYADYEHFSSRQLMVPKQFAISQLIPVGADPPDHLQYRHLVNKIFSPAAVKKLGVFIRAFTRELIDRIEPRGQCDFWEEFAKELPIAVFFKLANFPIEDREKLVTFMDMLLHPESLEDQQAAFAGCAEYLAPLFEERRKNPGEDLLSAIGAGEVFGRPVTNDEAVNMGTSFIIGGLDTVLSLMSFTMNYLAGDVALRHLLRDEPDRIPDAVEEFCRRFPIGVSTRLIRDDYELDGVQLKGGDLITLPQILHAFDPAEYPDPLKVDIERATGGYSTFGHGIHRCPGSFLGKYELRILLEEWLPRIPDFEVEAGFEAVITPGITSAIRHLPLRWAARPQGN